MEEVDILLGSVPAGVVDYRWRVEGNQQATLLLPRVIFPSNFLHAVTFLDVLHLDVLRRQIETETEREI